MESIRSQDTQDEIENLVAKMLKRAELNQRIENSKTLKKYAIFSTPRTASSMLCEKLSQTKLLGQPLEWFNLRYIESYLKIMKIEQCDLRQYLEILYRGTTNESNIFGVKIHIDQYVYWKKRGLDLNDLGFDKIYWMERPNKVRQAISLARASKTDQWVSRGRHADAERIDPSIGEVVATLARIMNEISYFESEFKGAVERKFGFDQVIADQGQSTVLSVASDLDVTIDPKLEALISARSFHNSKQSVDDKFYEYVMEILLGNIDKRSLNYY